MQCERGANKHNTGGRNTRTASQPHSIGPNGGNRERRSATGWATGAQQGVAAGDACSAGEAGAAQRSQARRGARGLGEHTVGGVLDAAPGARSAAAADEEKASTLSGKELAAAGRSQRVAKCWLLRRRTGEFI